MPHILLLRLSAPMQSWGVMSRFSRRDTGKEPSKSGVIGLISAAMGISRDEANSENQAFAEIAGAKMAVVALREGVLQSDYHTAQNIAIASARQRKDGSFETKDTEISTRFYLADADFVVALAAENRDALDRAHFALQNPKWQLFLGRKSFVPDEPVYFHEGVIETTRTLADFLANDLASIIEKYRDEDRGRARHGVGRCRLVIDDDTGSESRSDVPLSFAERRFTNRRVRTTYIDIKGGENDAGDLSDANGAEPTVAGGLE